jgi:hypothetical protein
MIAAIQAPKSTDRNLPDAEKSVTRQVLIWGRTQKRDGWGQRVTRRGARQRPLDDWIRVDRPDLRIVAEASGMARRNTSPGEGRVPRQQ